MKHIYILFYNLKPFNCKSMLLSSSGAYLLKVNKKNKIKIKSMF